MAVPRCTLLPLPEHQVSFRVSGTERLRWHFGPQYLRPFFFPLVGPASGESLTRMGHPGAPDHDHHRSVWFAHEKVSGLSFAIYGVNKLRFLGIFAFFAPCSNPYHETAQLRTCCRA
jgi:hypothetical protein